MQNYKELELNAGETIEQAVELLQKCNQLCKLKFNGHWLYSDTVTLDSAYKEITGRTKAEDDNYQKEEKDKREKQEKEHEEAIPELTKKWIDAGHKVLDKSVWEWWDRIVPIRLGDLYQGMELSCCLDIISALNSGVSFEVANEIFDKQGHSGMSYSLVKSMVYKCGDKGKKFVEWLVVKESV